MVHIERYDYMAFDSLQEFVYLNYEIIMSRESQWKDSNISHWNFGS